MPLYSCVIAAITCGHSRGISLLEIRQKHELDIPAAPGGKLSELVFF